MIDLSGLIYDSSPADLVSHLSNEVARKTEASLLAQLNDFISRGLIEVEYGPMTFVRNFERDEVTYSRSVNLRLKDREYIERLERENKALRDVSAILNAAIKAE